MNVWPYLTLHGGDPAMDVMVSRRSADQEIRRPVIALHFIDVVDHNFWSQVGNAVLNVEKLMARRLSTHYFLHHHSMLQHVVTTTMPCGMSRYAQV